VEGYQFLLELNEDMTPCLKGCAPRSPDCKLARSSSVKARTKWALTSWMMPEMSHFNNLFGDGASASPAIYVGWPVMH